MKANSWHKIKVFKSTSNYPLFGIPKILSYPLFFLVSSFRPVLINTISILKFPANLTFPTEGQVYSLLFSSHGQLCFHFPYNLYPVMVFIFPACFRQNKSESSGFYFKPFPCIDLLIINVVL